MVQHERYSFHSSPLYGRLRQKDLAAHLGLSKAKLESLVSKKFDFYSVRDEEINGKKRRIVTPLGRLRRVHERLRDLLNRIYKQKCIYSPKKGVKALDNANAHAGGSEVVKLDIRQFYPSTTSEHVFQFFYYIMKQRKDVAGLLAKVCTFDNVLPFGSPVSPVLCALVHDDVFTEIGEVTGISGNKVTVWVDDIVVSGQRVHRNTIWQIKQAIRKKGLATHKNERRSLKNGVVITGIFIDQAGPRVSNRTHLKIKQKLSDYDNAHNDVDKLACVSSLIGLHNYALHNEKASYRRIDLLNRRKEWLHHERRRLEKQVSKPELKENAPVAAEVDNSVPWD